MVFPDVIQEYVGKRGGIDGSTTRDEMAHLGYPIYHYPNCMMNRYSRVDRLQSPLIYLAMLHRE